MARIGEDLRKSFTNVALRNHSIKKAAIKLHRLDDRTTNYNYLYEEMLLNVHVIFL